MEGSQFQDGKGNHWDLKLNFGLVLDLKEHGLDLDEFLTDPEKFANLILMAPQKFVEMLYIICDEQIKTRELTPKQFGYLFDRETIDKAVSAFIQATISFYPRAAVGKALAGKVPEILAEMDRKLEEQTALHLSKMDLSIADSSASTPSPT